MSTYVAASTRPTLSGPRTPRSAIAALESAIRATCESAEFTSASEKLYVRPAFLPSQDFGDLIAREDAQLAKIMHAIGLKK